MADPEKKKLSKPVRGALIGASLAVVGISVASLSIVFSTRKRYAPSNVEVVTMNDPRISFSDLSFEGKEEYPYSYDAFVFDAEKGDRDGRVTATSRCLTHLSLTLTGTVTPKEYVQSLYYFLTIPDGVKNAVAKNYLMIDTGKEYVESLDPTLSRQKAELKNGSQEDSYSFSVTFGFRWGSFFHYENPSLYYDDAGEGGGASLSDEEMNAQMADFVKTMYYGDTPEEAIPSDLSNPPSLSFSLSLFAETKLE